MVVGLVAAAGTGERLGTPEPKAFVPCAGRARGRAAGAARPGGERAPRPATRSTGASASRSGGPPSPSSGRPGGTATTTRSHTSSRTATLQARSGRPAHATNAFGAVPPGHERPPDLVAGGRSRSASVRNALAAAPEADVAVVHDAARPLVTRSLVRRCLDALEGADGAIAAARVTDTVKEADGGGRVVRTLDRSLLWAVQTPQAFRAEALRRALDVDEAALSRATDDASLVEAAGGSVRVVEAPAENLKVTRPVDLRLAEALLEC